MVLRSGDFERYHTEFGTDLDAEYKTYPGSLNGTFHFHDNYEILLCLSDNMYCETEKGCLDVGRNTLLLFNNLDLHHFAPKARSGENHRYVVHFKPSYLTAVSTESINLTDCFLFRPFENACMLPLDETQAELIKAQIDKMIKVQRMVKEDLYGKDIYLQLILAELLLLTNTFYRSFHEISNEAFSQSYRYVYEMMEYIHANYTDELSLDILAKRFFVNKCNLCESFKSITGVSPNQYIINCRITKAKNLLINGNTVETACAEAGFNNLSHFSRTFKQRVGQSPKQYQKSMVKKYFQEEIHD